jgi:hypothetical protein
MLLLSPAVSEAPLTPLLPKRVEDEMAITGRSMLSPRKW